MASKYLLMRVKDLIYDAWGETFRKTNTFLQVDSR